jgi:predicted aspartyl protease
VTVATDEGLFIAASSLSDAELFTENQFAVQIQLASGDSTNMKIDALLDTGCSGSAFIDEQLAQKYIEKTGAVVIKLDRPRVLSTYEGKETAVVRHRIMLSFRIGNRQLLASAMVAKLGRHKVILGLPWMKMENLLLDPARMTIEFRNEGQNSKPYCIAGYSKEMPQVLPPPKATPLSRKIDIALIGAAPYALASREKESTVGSFSLFEIDCLLNPEPEREFDPTLVPEEYQEFMDVFSKKASNVLPPHRTYDHRIELEDGKSVNDVGYAPLYNMSRDELEEVKRYVEDNLAKGFIEASHSPVSSPILFVKKKDGSLRLYVDYRKLNAITKKDRYPLPLIDETLGQLKDCQVFTIIDIRQAFHRLRMHPESEEMTTFRTRHGSYKYRVLPFGLTGGPASFQRYINDVLFDGLDRYCTAYMDDILIFSKNISEHQHHVREVLKRLRQAGLQADIKKCQFNVPEVTYLGLIVGVHGIRPDPGKIEVVKEWKEPRHLKQLQAFLGFCNFYRRFVEGYSKIAKPLTRLTGKDVPYEFSADCQKAFQTLKDALISAPVLRHFDPQKTCYLTTDSSDWVSAGVLSQKDDDGRTHPVAFFSKKLDPAQCNYEIYDKELLAIVRCLEEWRPHLEGTQDPIQIVTDHQALEYFMSTKRLTRRQARWAETLSRYNFVITYAPGKTNHADALTRKPGDRPEGANDERLVMQERTLLGPCNVDSRCLENISLSPIQEQAEGQPDTNISLPDGIREAIQADEFCQSVLRDLREGRAKSKKIPLADCKEEDSLLIYRGKLWIPESARAQLLREVHESPEAGHPGIAKTMELLSRNYYWPRMDKLVTQWLNNCHICKRTKSEKSTPGWVRSLPVPVRPWSDISMDFITGLPKSGKDQYNAILVVVDRLSKMGHLIPCTTDDSGGTSAESTANMLITHVWKLHGLPQTIVSDRGPQFVSMLWKELCARLRIKRALSTAFHPQTDGQTEVRNARVEQYLRAYVSYQQDDWSRWLPMAEFAINNHKSDTLQMSPFFAVTGQHPRMSFDPVRKSNAKLLRKEEDGRKIAERMEDIVDHARGQMMIAQQRQEEQKNAGSDPGTAYKVGDKVWLLAKNLRTQRPSKKLDHKAEGPYRIKRVVNPVAFELDLPKSVKIHPVIHTSLLRLDPDNAVQDQVNEPPPPVIIQDQEEFEVEEIVDSRRFRNKLQYKVRWIGYPPDNTWYPADNFEHAVEARSAFHSRYPEKPKLHGGSMEG